MLIRLTILVMTGLHGTAQKMKFSRISLVNAINFVTFTEKILNEKGHFLCSVWEWSQYLYYYTITLLLLLLLLFVSLTQVILWKLSFTVWRHCFFWYCWHHLPYHFHHPHKTILVKIELTLNNLSITLVLQNLIRLLFAEWKERIFFV